MNPSIYNQLFLFSASRGKPASTHCFRFPLHLLGYILKAHIGITPFPFFFYAYIVLVLS